LPWEGSNLNFITQRRGDAEEEKKNINHGEHGVHGERKNMLNSVFSVFSVVKFLIILFLLLCVSAPLREVIGNKF
jgi:hypothetical protein